jgi:vesicle-fusing ATPase
MTNRKDMIDEAILRPGRLEIHLEIGLPDIKGRVQIFEIHTRVMNKNDLLAPDVDINKLATLTKNYTGSEISSVCRSASSFVLYDDPNKSLQEGGGPASVASGIQV